MTLSIISNEVEKYFSKQAVVKETTNFDQSRQRKFSIFSVSVIYCLKMLCTNCKISVAFHNKHNCTWDWKKMGVDRWFSWVWLGFLICSWLHTDLDWLQLWQPQCLGFTPHVFHPPAGESKCVLITKAKVQDREGRIVQVLFKTLLASNLLTTHWPNQVIWLSPK